MVLQPHAVRAGLLHGRMHLSQRRAVSIHLLRQDGGEAVPDRLGVAAGQAQIVLQKLGVALDHPGLPGLIDLLQLGKLGGQLLAAVIALQLIQRRRVAGGQIVQPVLQFLRGGGLERLQLTGQAAPVHSTVQTVLPQGVYVGGQLRVGGLHGIAALPHTILHPLDAGGVKEVEVKVLLLPQALRRVPDGVVLLPALAVREVQVEQRRRALRCTVAGSRNGAGVAAEARLGRAGGDLVGDVGDVSQPRDVHGGSS